MRNDGIDAGGIGSRFKIKVQGRVVAEAEDRVTARLAAKEQKRLHTTRAVSVYDRVNRNDEPID